MAEEVVHHPVESSNTEGAETTDRGLFDFLGAKKEEEKLPTSDYQQAEQVAIASEFEEKVHVSEPGPKCEEAEDKKPSLLSKLHRSGSSSSSSSSDEEEAKEGEEKKKKKKKLKEKVEEKIHKEEDSSVPVEKIEEAEEKKGFLDKIKEKLPGGGHKEEVPPPPPAAEVESYTAADGEPAKEKKGILEKIKEKIPGYHPKASDEDKKEKETYDH